MPHWYEACGKWMVQMHGWGQAWVDEVAWGISIEENYEGAQCSSGGAYQTVSVS